MEPSYKRIVDPVRASYGEAFDHIRLKLAAVETSANQASERASAAEAHARVARSAVDRLASDVAFLRASELERQERDKASERGRKMRYALAGTLGTAAIAAASAIGTAVIQGPLTATARAQSSEVASQRLDEQLAREKALLEEQASRAQVAWEARVAALRVDWERRRLDEERKSSVREPNP